MADPIVSVIIPTYNRLAWLRRAVDSCMSDAAIGGVPVEVVVVEDGGTDDTWQWLMSLDDLRIRPVRQTNAGPGRARNCGLKIARGKFVRFLDSDDWLVPGATQHQIAELTRTGADVAYGDVVDAFEAKDVLPQSGNYLGFTHDVLAELVGGRWTPPFSYLYCRNSLNGVSWPIDLASGEDFRFVLDVALSQARFCYTHELVGYYFHHEKPRVSSANRTAWRLAMIETLEHGAAVLDRREEWTDERRAGIARAVHNVSASFVGEDEAGFQRCLSLIESVCPTYLPAAGAKRVLARAVGLERTERLLHKKRRLAALLARV